ncbi:MAG TPA: ABC transporter permease [Ktedonobacterales bacterium]
MTTSQITPTGAPAGTLELTPELTQKRRGQLRIIVDRFLRNKLAVASLVILLIMVILAALAPVLTHTTLQVQPAIDPDPVHAFAPPSAAHLLGTDDIGRDEFARLLYGAQVSLAVGVFAMMLTIIIGVVLGSIAGYYGGWFDTLLMRVTDAFLSVPFLLILFVLSKVFSGGRVVDVVLLIGLFSWPGTARIVRAEFLSYKEREFLMAARTLGAGNFRLMFRHILPNAAGPIIVSATLLVGGAIITESTLSFFGFGIQPPTPSWGNMLTDSREYIFKDPLLLYLPGLAILLVVLCFNLIGDGLRDALDPYMTER